MSFAHPLLVLARRLALGSLRALCVAVVFFGPFFGACLLLFAVFAPTGRDRLLYLGCLAVCLAVMGAAMATSNWVQRLRWGAQHPVPPTH